MRRDVRFAAVARDDGLRRVGRLTWQAGLVGVVCSGLIALAFGVHTNAQAARSGSGGGSSSSSSSGGGGSGSGGGGAGSGGGSISVPAQPPAPGQGAPQVNSGGS